MFDIDKYLIIIKMIKMMLILLIPSVYVGKLLQSLIVFRHGARYQDNDAYDGNKTKNYWG